MSVKPLSGSIPSLFTTGTLFGKTGEPAETKAAMALFKSVGKKAEPMDEVSFSSQALAALKSGAGTAASRPTPTLAAPAVAAFKTAALNHSATHVFNDLAYRTQRLPRAQSGHNRYGIGSSKGKSPTGSSADQRPTSGNPLLSHGSRTGSPCMG
ncbi:hypothetical protein ACIU1J_10390 [Azospirillum doebereinerae]|uniref:hypothetical protein n=1 Tax=Azospirillum doebereinerae TaxID=92933 RepID=UPI001EE607BD|nr:hypothetical protein [Azospirillum doebereinerae]MCG5243024.1 hypothetical protein [Azospirillum doebereinerae]